MKRREFIAASAALLVSPRRSLAQGTRRRVGFLAMDVVAPTVQSAWLDGLRNHGWIDGKNLIITQLDPLDRDGRMLDNLARNSFEFCLCR